MGLNIQHGLMVFNVPAHLNTQCYEASVSSTSLRKDVLLLELTPACSGYVWMC